MLGEEREIEREREREPLLTEPKALLPNPGKMLEKKKSQNVSVRGILQVI